MNRIFIEREPIGLFLLFCVPNAPILTKSSYCRRREGEWEDGTEGPRSGGGLRVPGVLTTAQLSPHGRSLQLRLTGLGWTSCSYLLRDQGCSSPHQSGETSVQCIQESHKRWTSSFHECQNHIFHICKYLYITNHNPKQDYYDLEWILHYYERHCLPSFMSQWWLYTKTKDSLAWVLIVAVQLHIYNEQMLSFKLCISQFSQQYCTMDGCRLLAAVPPTDDYLCDNRYLWMLLNFIICSCKYDVNYTDLSCCQYPIKSKVSWISLFVFSFTMFMLIYTLFNTKKCNGMSKTHKKLWRCKQLLLLVSENCIAKVTHPHIKFEPFLTECAVL